MLTLEENALHIAAVNYARARFQTLETRMRVDRALRIQHFLEISEDLDRETLDDVEELARLTLLHAGEQGRSKPTPRPTHSEALLLRARLIVRNAQGHFTDTDQTLRHAVLAFNELVGLLSTCSRLAGDPECRRDGDCPEHGRNRPGQCVTEERGSGVDRATPRTSEGSGGPGGPGSGSGEESEW